ncbi:VWA domain-containing protein [Virgibacillus necropolis]|uniref:vWA domain-containing protein n=1 Tax=Virgibacillus necropolis TaxID=163877 RepID=UPI0038500711
MNNIKTFFLIIVIALIFVLTGCSNEEATKDKEEEKTEQPAEPEEKEKEEVTAPEAATEPEEMVKEGPGALFTAEDMNAEKFKKAIESLPEDLTADEAYNHLIHLMAADFGPALKKYEDFNPSFLVDDAPGSEDEQKNEKEKEMHVALLLDASGSMGAYVGGQMKMEAAKESLKKFVTALPTETKVLLRVYGHKGTGSDADKKMSCSSTEVVYPLSTYNKEKFNKSLSQFKPAGWTPLAASIKAAKKDLQGKTGEDVKNVVYIISDGEETCGGDPVQAAKQLHDSGIATAVNIIGFDVGNEAQEQLKKVAEAGGGTFTNVQTGKEMVEVVESNMKQAHEAVELNMWSAVEGVDLTWDAIHKNDELDSIASNFDEVIEDENGLLLNGLEGLEQTKKITEQVATELKGLITERHDKLEQFNEHKKQELEKRVEEEKQKASDLIDKVRKEKAQD